MWYITCSEGWTYFLDFGFLKAKTLWAWKTNVHTKVCYTSLCASTQPSVPKKHDWWKPFVTNCIASVIIELLLLISAHSRCDNTLLVFFKSHLASQKAMGAEERERGNNCQQQETKERGSWKCQKRKGKGYRQRQNETETRCNRES